MQNDLTRTSEVLPSGKDRTGAAPYSMSNMGKKSKVKTLPSSFVRHNERSYT